MAKLHTMEKIVLEVLEKCPNTRLDDYILMLEVCKKTNPSVVNYPFGLVMQNHHFNIPNWETVTRCRRKIQAKRPDLVAPFTARKRKNEEEVYKEYARS